MGLRPLTKALCLSFFPFLFHTIFLLSTLFSFHSSITSLLSLFSFIFLFFSLFYSFSFLFFFSSFSRHFLFFSFFDPHLLFAFISPLSITCLVCLHVSVSCVYGTFGLNSCYFLGLGRGGGLPLRGFHFVHVTFYLNRLSATKIF